MSNHLYGYGGAAAGGYGAAAAGGYGAGSGNPYLSDLAGASRYGAAAADSLSAAGVYSSLYGVDRFGLSSGVGGAGGYGGYGAGAAAASAASAASAYSQKPWAGVGAAAAADAVSAATDAKRSAEALYHQNVLGSNTIGQTEGLFSIKRPRYEIASNQPTYPQRPGQKDCPHYMLTRACKFGVTCKFDHPVWVPEGGIPDWKEIPVAPSSEGLPERPGEPDCHFYLKTQNCKFGLRCKFNHPKDKLGASSDGGVVGSIDNAQLPERPSEPICSFYAKTGTCKFGAICKFNHPKDVQIPVAGQDNGSAEQAAAAAGIVSDDAGGDSKPTKTFIPFTRALLHNSKGLPIRQGETDCPFYLKTGSCKYGATCRYNHPERIIASSVTGPLGHSVVPSTPANLSLGIFGTAANILPNVDPRLAQAAISVNPNVYPQRPGQTECDFYMKSGHCSFGERCRFHHPIDRSAPTKQGLVQNVKLTLAGLPRREDSAACPFYMKTGICKYGATCRFDHPPPGEAVALATGAGTSATAGTDEDENVAAEPAQEQ